MQFADSVLFVDEWIIGVEGIHMLEVHRIQWFIKFGLSCLSRIFFGTIAHPIQFFLVIFKAVRFLQFRNDTNGFIL